jgi:hypothetical protein
MHTIRNFDKKQILMKKKCHSKCILLEIFKKKKDFIEKTEICDFSPPKCSNHRQIRFSRVKF